MPPQDPLIKGSSSKHAKHVDYSTISTMEQLDPHVPIPRLSVLKRGSFLVQVATTRGPPEIMVIVLLYAFGFGSTIGIIPNLMASRFARLSHGYDDSEGDCSSFSFLDKPEACLAGSGDARNATAMANLISNTFTLLMSSMMGTISDIHGRRSVMILGMSLSCLAPLGLLWVMVSPDASPWWYYLAHASNCLVSWTAVCISALNDVMPPEWRAPSVGLVMAGIMLGVSISPSVALMTDPMHMAWLSVVLTFGALAVSICFFPETLPPHVREEARKRSEAEHVEPTFMGKLTWSVTRPFREISILNRNSFFRLLSCLGFFSGMVSSGDRTLLVYYVEERLAFEASDVAYMFLLIGGLGFLTQILILKPVNDLIGERWLITSCFIVSVIQNLLYGLASDKSMIYASATIGALTTMAYPTISAIKANNGEESEQGRIQGALYSLQAVASAIGPVAMQLVDNCAKKTSYLGPGTMFFFAASLQLIAVSFAYALPKDKANSRGSTDSATGLRRSFLTRLDENDEEEDMIPESSA